jgi:hypothetical protein
MPDLVAITSVLSIIARWCDPAGIHFTGAADCLMISCPPGITNVRTFFLRGE